MKETELQKIVDAWIVAQEAEEGSTEHEKNQWALSEVIWWPVRDQSDLLWRFILTAYQRELSENASGMLAAGPIENLLSTFGEEYIGRVEELAAKDERFKSILCDVWRLGMTDEAGARLRSARRGANCPADL
jgi:hypothetical protein